MDVISIFEINCNLDPMTFSILFPYGEIRWDPDIKLRSYIDNEYYNVTLIKWKIAQLAIRDDEYNSILNSGKLCQQWIVDSYLQVEQKNLNFIRFNQEKLRVELFIIMMIYLNDSNNPNRFIPGKRVILPSSFNGSPRCYRELYHDSMALIQLLGKSDLFITFTCNLNWQETKSILNPLHQLANDRPDLISRVFKLKLKSLKDDIITKGIFGKVNGYVYTIEFQKRGLPYCHLLVFLDDNNKYDTVELIDKLISAGIPDPIKNKAVYDVVINCMLHGLCGDSNIGAPSMSVGECSRGFTKTFNESTRMQNNSFHEYRSRDNGTKVNINGSYYDNLWVVLYNLFFAAKI